MFSFERYYSHIAILYYCSKTNCTLYTPRAEYFSNKTGVVNSSENFVFTVSVFDFKEILSFAVRTFDEIRLFNAPNEPQLSRKSLCFSIEFEAKFSRYFIFFLFLNETSNNTAVAFTNDV